MDGILFSVQMLMTPPNLMVMDGCWYHSNTIRGSFIFKVALTAFGPVNLDFFWRFLSKVLH